MTKKSSERYEIDPEDGLRREIVGDWSAEKHLRLRNYVGISAGARSRFDKTGTSYIELYCGPGRARIQKTNEIVDGSAVVAATEAIKRCAFTSVHVADMDPLNVEACVARLNARHISSVKHYTGASAETVKQVTASIHPLGLHLAFLDPYSITALPFSVLRELARLKRMDLLIHVSAMDLRRNLRILMQNGSLEGFAPGYNDVINPAEKDELVVQKVFSHWCASLVSLGYHVSERVEKVSGSRNQLLYWLVAATRHALADSFWGKISNVQPQQNLF
jgi:three-Cys-motif partner protein